ncbi:MAG: hypothetical protein KAH32_04625 [Chlamydiia bacterium]|nr:hypothetical protein [Chlamydiia bacterium]
MNILYKKIRKALGGVKTTPPITPTTPTTTKTTVNKEVEPTIWKNVDWEGADKIDWRGKNAKHFLANDGRYVKDANGNPTSELNPMTVRYLKEMNAVNQTGTDYTADDMVSSMGRYTTPEIRGGGKNNEYKRNQLSDRVRAISEAGGVTQYSPGTSPTSLSESLFGQFYDRNGYTNDISKKKVTDDDIRRALISSDPKSYNRQTWTDEFGNGTVLNGAPGTPNPMMERGKSHNGRYVKGSRSNGGILYRR